MLAICSWFTPYNWACLILYLLAISVNGLSITLHVSLLKVSRETLHILVIRQNYFGLSTEEIHIPDTNKCKDHRDIFLKRSVSKMMVHLKSTLQQLCKVFISDVACNR